MCICINTDFTMHQKGVHGHCWPLSISRNSTATITGRVSFASWSPLLTWRIARSLNGHNEIRRSSIWLTVARCRYCSLRQPSQTGYSRVIIQRSWGLFTPELSTTVGGSEYP
ncbi:hypothetical protein SCLCIDRAFT_401465 [Scleroderma citrinum Foug A]|uniref:Uncharacterized protein n=1 Tax=Scleroderma citrinum Foug A TaxID=1036808 RepID=A0A0C3DD67_9AGAM|nr:hypothetical protein SCLCIDRAFT_401465 [Scleroderma citrinum Foug A]